MQGDPQATMQMISNLLGSVDIGDDRPVRSQRDMAIRLSQLNSVGLNLEELMIMEATRRSMMEQPQNSTESSTDDETPLALINNSREGE
jgi:hypothetical protein